MTSRVKSKILKISEINDQINMLVSEKEELQDQISELESDKDKLASDYDENKQLLEENRAESNDSTKKIADLEEKLKEERDLVSDLLSNVPTGKSQEVFNKKVLIYTNTSNREMIVQHIAQQYW